jgi:hypothetical protein
VLAELIGHHPRYAAIPHEARFHAEPSGLPGLLRGKVSMNRFLSTMRERFQADHLGRPGGLDRFVDAEVFDPALDVFADRFERDPIGASRYLVRALLDPVAEREGKPAWVEMTPRNVFFAKANIELFPRMKLIHIMRDGRDTASSMVNRRLKRTGHSTDLNDALRWWEDRRLGAIRGTRGFPPSQLLSLRLEELVERDRQGSYKRLLAFLGVEDDECMRRFFEAEVTVSKANIGRWREHFRNGHDAREFLDLHRSIERSLREKARDRVAGGTH